MSITAIIALVLLVLLITAGALLPPIFKLLELRNKRKP